MLIYYYMLNRSYINGHKGHPHYATNLKIMSLQRITELSWEEENLLRMVRNLSDPTKLKIYLLLHKVKEIAVSDIVYLLGVSQSAISHALSDLKNLGLIEAHRCGQLICYSLISGKKKNSFFKLL